MSVSRLEPGVVFANDYRVVKHLSEGGMGAVYVVHQLSTGRARALKLMHAEFVANADLRRRFEQEAQIGARIDSEHVVEVQAAGIDVPTGLPFLVMELLEGEDLARFVARGAPAARVVVDVFEQLSHAMCAAHVAGIVHRDLKPENIFIGHPRRVGVAFTLKVLDFGIAKLLAEGQTKNTAAFGSPMWLAPEQTERSPVTPAADVWALGLIAFYLLTGRSFWKSAEAIDVTATQLLREILFEPLPPASVRAREMGIRPLPPSFDAWFGQCVAREPTARFPSATEMHAALGDALAERAAPSLPLPLAATALSLGSVQMAPTAPMVGSVVSSGSPANVVPQEIAGPALGQMATMPAPVANGPAPSQSATPRIGAADHERIRAAVSRAREIVARGTLRTIPNSFGDVPSAYYTAGDFTLDGESWVVCTARMYSSSFQLLDATVHERLKRGARYAVALLQARPAEEGTGPEPTETYLRRYQQVAWSALGVAWVLAAGKHDGVFLADPSLTRVDGGTFAAIASKIQSRLDAVVISPRPVKSRDAEAAVLPHVDAVLREMGFTLAESRKYTGFWRRPQADGLWQRSTDTKESFGLEVKLDEDPKVPLCQAVELLGHVDGMACVRVAARTAAWTGSHADHAKALLEDGAPMRYLTVGTR